MSSNDGRDRKNETGAGVAQARPVTGLIFRVDALVMRYFFLFFQCFGFWRKCIIESMNISSFSSTL